MPQHICVVPATSLYTRAAATIIAIYRPLTTRALSVIDCRRLAGGSGSKVLSLVVGIKKFKRHVTRMPVRRKRGYDASTLLDAKTSLYMNSELSNDSFAPAAKTLYPSMNGCLDETPGNSTRINAVIADKIRKCRYLTTMHQCRSMKLLLESNEEGFYPSATCKSCYFWSNANSSPGFRDGEERWA